MDLYILIPGCNDIVCDFSYGEDTAGHETIIVCGRLGPIEPWDKIVEDVR